MEQKHYQPAVSGIFRNYNYEKYGLYGACKDYLKLKYMDAELLENRRLAERACSRLNAGDYYLDEAYRVCGKNVDTIHALNDEFSSIMDRVNALRRRVLKK